MPTAICRAGFLVTLGAVAAACTSVSMRQGEVPGVQPPRLLSAGTLELPHDCSVTPGAVYRADFVVGPDGDVDSVSPGMGPQCARDALAEWIRTFRYEPGASSSAATIDWMAVVARR